MTLKIHEFGETTRACNEVRWHLRIQADGGASARAEMATEEPPERLYMATKQQRSKEWRGAARSVASARAEKATEEPPERLYVVNCTHAFVF
jgi:hypothetical protein